MLEKLLVKLEGQSRLFVAAGDVVGPVAPVDGFVEDEGVLAADLEAVAGRTLTEALNKKKRFLFCKKHQVTQHKTIKIEQKEIWSKSMNNTH